MEKLKKLCDSLEGKLILDNFAARRRLVMYPVILTYLKFKLSQTDTEFSREGFDHIFDAMVEAGLGTYHFRIRGPSEIKRFVPAKALPDIARIIRGEIPYRPDATFAPIIDREKVPEPKTPVTIIFKLDGLPCKAFIHEKAVPKFETMLADCI